MRSDGRHGEGGQEGPEGRGEWEGKGKEISPDVHF